MSQYRRAKFQAGGEVTTTPNFSGLREQNALGLEEGPLYDPKLHPTFQAIFPEMQRRLASRAITPAERELVKTLCNDTNAIWDLVLAMLQVYQSVADTGRYITLHQNPSTQTARHFITDARFRLGKMIDVVKKRQLAHSSLPAGTTRTFFTMITRFRVPGPSIAPKGTRLTLTYGPQHLLAALGEVSGVMEANIIIREERKMAEPDAKRRLQDALIWTALELDALEGVVGSFKLPQCAQGLHHDGDARVSLGETASLLHGHFEDCVAMASFIKAKLEGSTAKPSRVQHRSHITTSHGYGRNVYPPWI